MVKSFRYTEIMSKEKTYVRRSSGAKTAGLKMLAGTRSDRLVIGIRSR